MYSDPLHSGQFYSCWLFDESNILSFKPKHLKHLNLLKTFMEVYRLYSSMLRVYEILLMVKLGRVLKRKALVLRVLGGAV